MLHDDVLDEQIRSALHETSVAGFDVGTAEAAVRARAASRRTRRRAVGVLGSVAAAGLLVFVATSTARDDSVVTDAPADSTSTTLASEYGFPPLTPLVDAALPVIPSTVLTEDVGHVLSVESGPGALALRLTYPTGGAGGMSGDPLHSPALVSFTTGPASNDPVPRSYVAGFTRLEVARVALVTDSQTTTVDTIEHPSLPQVRFFLMEIPGDATSVDRALQEQLLVAYAADGTVLTDSGRIRAEGNDFFEAMDRRAGGGEIGSRVIIDDRTGEQIPLRSDA